MPDSGQAGPSRQIGEPAPEPLRVAPPGPRPGADPAEVVGGFLRAGAASDADQVVARSFLVGAAITGWRPAQGVLVYPDDAWVKVAVRGKTSPVRVDVQTPVQATIDAQGRYAQAPPGTTAHATFTVLRTAGTWRVSAVDEAFGSWLPTFALDRTTSALPVTYIAADSMTLVPDLRWFAGPRQGLATALVRQLLSGPPAYLGSAVRTGFPRGTALAVDAVPTTDGVAQVDLSAQALAATPEMRSMMWAQLVSTLGRLQSVTDVQLTVGGAPFQVPGVTSTSVYGDTRFQDDVPVRADPLVLTGDRLDRVDPVGGGLSPGAARLANGTQLQAVSVGPGGSPVVGVGAPTGGHGSGRTQLLRLRAGSPPAVLLDGTSLVDPVVDMTGALWSADLALPGQLQVVPAAAVRAAPPAAPTATTRTATPAPASATVAAATQLRPAWLAGRTIRSFDVSRDGTRLAVVSSGPGGVRRVDVAGVVRGVAGRPLALAPRLQVGLALTDVIDVAWVDRSTLAVLGRSGRTPTRPFEVVIGGPATPLPRVAGAVSLAAGDGPRAIYVVTAAGRVVARSGAGWVDVGPGRSVSIGQ